MGLEADAEAGPDARLGGEVDHDIDPVQQAREVIRAEVHWAEVEKRLVIQPFKVPLLVGSGVVAREAIESEHFRA